MPRQNQQPVSDDPEVVLAFATPQEALAVGGLDALDVEDNEETASARALVQDRWEMLARLQASIVTAEAAAQMARDALQACVEARLRGTPDDEEEHARHQAVEASLQLDTLTTLEIKIGQELKDAEAALVEAVHRHKLHTVQEQWDRLATEQGELAKRFQQLLNELARVLGRMREVAVEQRPLAAIVGTAVDWRRAETRLLIPLLSATLRPILHSLDLGVAPASRSVVQGTRFEDLWPYARRVDTPAPVAESEP